jgi:hypothetical protein
MSAGKHIHPEGLNAKESVWVSLLDDLQVLLERQIELAQAGNIRSVEVLSKQANFLTGKIAETGMLGRPEFKSRREQLQKLYDGLSLAIIAQKAETCGNLSRVRKGRKAIGTYRSNI